MASVLFLTSEQPDYLQDQLVLGLKQMEGVACIDYPRKDILYEDCTVPDSELHGSGFTIWKTIEERTSVDRDDVFQRLSEGAFDALVFGSIQRQEAVLERIEPGAVDCPIVFLDGEDMRYPPSPGSVPSFLAEWIGRHRRGMGGRPQIGAEVYQPALGHGHYFKREKTDAVCRVENAHPISFSIPERKIRGSRPQKERTFQTHVQCDIAYKLDEVAETCTTEPIFDTEAAYYDDLAASKYGITMKKGGWECMRHYEIAANWAVPCFYNLSQKPTECAPHGLRDLENCVAFSSAAELQRKVDYIDRNGLYETIQSNAVDWTTRNTCKRTARYVLDTIGALPDERGSETEPR